MSLLTTSRCCIHHVCCEGEGMGVAAEGEEVGGAREGGRGVGVAGERLRVVLCGPP